MKKRIWLINQYAMPPKYEARIQTLKRAQYLMQAGYDVTIISGSFLHNTDINLITDRKRFIKKNYNGFDFIHIKTIKYKGNSIKRLYSLIEFPIRLFILAKKFEKPDVISQIATVPFGNLIYYIAKKLKAKYIVDVVDLWPEAAVLLGIISKKNPLLKLAYFAEKWLYKKADNIIFSMQGGKDYIVEKKWNKEEGGPIDLNKVRYINNGVDLNDFNNNKTAFKIDDSTLEDESYFKVIYLGSIRLANNVKLLIEAANLLKEFNKIIFLIYGDGDDRESLEKYCYENEITNVIFKQKWVELKYVPYILSKSSLNILNYNPSPIFKYGGSQSKLFQYMASGKPICSNLEMGYCPITKYNLGIAKDFKSPQEYADTIYSFYKMEKINYMKICDNALDVAKKYDYKKLTEKFIEII